jgi:hypothetical protein
MKRLIVFVLIVGIGIEIIMLLLFLTPELVPSALLDRFVIEKSRPQNRNLDVSWRPMPEAPPEMRGKTHSLFSFNREDALEEWEERSFRGKVVYKLEFAGDEGYVHAAAERAASARYQRLRYDLRNFPHLAWWWRAGRFPAKSLDLDPRARDDYPTRVVVVFASRFFKNFRCLEYVWELEEPEDPTEISPWSDNIRRIILESGGENGEWRYEERNVLVDYRALFGERPSFPVRAIGIMTDADNTESFAEGFFDDIWIGSLEKGAGTP